MTENLLEASISDAPRPDAAVPIAVASAGRASRPAGLPDKFWDEKAGQVRLDALIKSYSELEKKLSGLSNRDVPGAPEDYKLSVKNELLTPIRGQPQAARRRLQPGSGAARLRSRR